MIRSILIQILAVLLLSSCGIHKTSTKTNQSHEVKQEIIFQSFLIQKEGSGIHISKQGQDRVAGNIKPDLRLASHFHNPLEVVFIDKSDKQIDKLFIEHPLISIYETSTPEGILSKTTQQRDSATFFIRFNFHKDISTVRFRTITECPIPIDQKLEI